MRMNIGKKYVVQLIVLVIVAVNCNDCKGEIVNSIAARVNDHVITLRDMEIELYIQGKLFGKDNIQKDILWRMIDDHLILAEIKKSKGKDRSNGLKARVDDEVKKFKGKFTAKEYEKFLDELEIGEDDVYLRFKNKALTGDFLNKRAAIKKNGSKNAKNMVLKSKRDDRLVATLKNYILSLREKADIMINFTNNE